MSGTALFSGLGLAPIGLPTWLVGTQGSGNPDVRVTPAFFGNNALLGGADSTGVADFAPQLQAMALHSLFRFAGMVRGWCSSRGARGWLHSILPEIVSSKAP